MKIKNKQINEKSQTLIIAEIGMNHNGSYENAIRLIDQSKSAGADIVKFQLRDMDAVYSKDSLTKNNADLSTQYTIDLLQKFQLSPDQYKALFEYCNSVEIDWICTPWDKNSLNIFK